jgi:necrosis-inducing secreted protein 1
MVSFKSLAVAATSLASLPSTFAYIYSISTPEAGKVGQPIPVTLNTSIYIQNYDDFGVIWGLAPPNFQCEGCVGPKLGYTNLV